MATNSQVEQMVAAAVAEARREPSPALSAFDTARIKQSLLECVAITPLRQSELILNRATDLSLAFALLDGCAEVSPKPQGSELAAAAVAGGREVVNALVDGKLITAAQGALVLGLLKNVEGT